MRRPNFFISASKVFYSPMEAAVRWSGLQRHETRILAAVGDKHLPDVSDFPQWPLLRLNAERLFDALTNGDLAYGKNGVTHQDPSLLDDSGLTVRHVDLKLWMSRFYPDERPGFLFDAIERTLHPAVSIDTVHVLLADHKSLQIQLAGCTKNSDSLRAQIKTLCREHEVSCAAKASALGSRSEATYLGIVGGLLTLLLGKSPGGSPYSSFTSQEAVISALVAHHGNLLGISRSTLENKFAQAKRRIHAR